MPYLLERLDAAGSVIIEVTWIPILVWTIAGLVLLGSLRVFQQIHVQYHYHLRLSILMSLPVGLILAFILHPASGLFNGTDPTGTILKLITVQAPHEFIGSTENPATPLINVAEWRLPLVLLLTAGSMLMTGWYFIQYFRLQRLTQTLKLIPINLMDPVDKMNRRIAKDSRQKIFVTYLNRPIVPVTYCLKHPIIILPAFLSEDREKLNLVLRHELMHIKNRDHFTHLLMIVIRSLFWYHPLVHYLYFQLIEFREMRCDNHVLADQRISRRKYASVLFELLPMPTINGEISFHMAQHTSKLKKRIDMICSNSVRRLPVRAGLSTFGLFLILTAIVMAGTELENDSLFESVEATFTSQTTDTDISNTLNEIRLTLEDIENPPQAQTLNQTDDIAWEQSDVEFARTILNETRQMEPELIGGLETLQKNIKYPTIAARAGIDGFVLIEFEINKDGGVENPKVVRGIGGGADEEALRVVQQARFTPAIQLGQPVRVTYTLPILFRLTAPPEGAQIQA